MTNYNPTMEEILNLARDGRLIELIKIYRHKTGKGLKDSKDAIESARSPYGGRNLDVSRIQEIFVQDCGYKYKSPNPYTKEELMNVIEHAIDNADIYHMNILNAVGLFVENVTNRGGLEYLERERDKFLNSI